MIPTKLLVIFSVMICLAIIVVLTSMNDYIKSHNADNNGWDTLRVIGIVCIIVAIITLAFIFGSKPGSRWEKGLWYFFLIMIQGIMIMFPSIDTYPNDTEDGEIYDRLVRVYFRRLLIQEKEKEQEQENNFSQ